MPTVVRRILSSLGPGLIVAAVVLGPGSISAISANGSVMGTRLLWLVLVSGAFMMTYTMLAAKFGAFSDMSFLGVLARRYGRWLSVLIGVCAFIVCAGFQSGNNIGVGMAMNAVLGGPIWLWACVFTVLALVFMFVFRSLYQALEKLMMALVVLMILAFVSNLAVAGPDPLQVGRGLIPGLFPGKYLTQVAAIVATSFSVIGALFQSYLVQEKEWGPAQVGRGLRDSAVGITALTLISMVVLVTSATVLATRGIEVKNAGDMAVQLEPLLGRSAKWLFCLGLWGASFSSFLGNAICGGTLLSDGLGLGHRIGSLPAKIIAAVIMLIGTTVAVLSSRFSVSPVTVIIVAQAVTVITVPLACFMIFWVSNNKEVMAGTRPRWWVNVLAVLGLIAVCVLALITVLRLSGSL
ncbi:MAG: Nramp family divalent metal transporter [Candidatus Glassbacteria bacterium]|nr:Nramp family divalent metal transporter [Candidatus Glassbacteria bacterium]